MSPLTDSTDVITVTHRGLRGKEALRKHLNLFTIQAILHKYLMQRQCIVSTPFISCIQGGGGGRVALWGVSPLLSEVEI